MSERKRINLLYGAERFDGFEEKGWILNEKEERSVVVGVGGLLVSMFSFGV